MSEYQIETRRRSRSKTPFLRSLCDHENCEHADGEPHHHPPQRKRAKTPNVRTIVEEEVVTSSSSPHTSASAQKAGGNKQAEEQVKSKTSDYSSENKARKSLRSEFTEIVTTTAAATTVASAVIKSTTFSSSSTTSLTRKITKTSGGNTEGNMATSTPKANNFNVQKSFAAQYSESAVADESRQNQLNATQERVRKSLYNSGNIRNDNNSYNSNKSNNSKDRQSFGQSFNSSSTRSMISNVNIDPKEHLPYMEYKNAGEYWNVTPKTDYTYSELSPHRRELAPGVVAMPNMSRHSLGNYNARVHAMIERYPEKEEWIRRRYKTDSYATDRYDSSGDEVDFLYTDQEVQKSSWIKRFFSSILTFFITIWQSIAGPPNKRTEEQLYQENYYRKYYGKSAVQSKGFFGRITSAFLNVYSYFYSFASKILEYDLRLLGMRSRENAERKSRFWLLLLFLFPWLLLGAWYLLGGMPLHDYFKQTEALLPLSFLSTLKTGFTNSAQFFKNNIPQIPNSLWHVTGRYSSQADTADEHLQELENNLRKTLTKTEYENLMDHVSKYMEQLVELKMQNQRNKVKEESLELIKEQIRLMLLENKEQFKKQINLKDMSEEQMNQLSLHVLKHLHNKGWKPMSTRLYEDANLKMLYVHIREQIQLNNKNLGTNLIEEVDLKEFLERLLSLPPLTDFIDQRILQNVDRKEYGTQSQEVTKQKSFIDLKNDLDFIKLSLADKLSENADLHRSVSKLQIVQDEMLQKLHEHEQFMDERFSALLLDIEKKLSDIEENRLILLNKQVKLVLVDIFGFKRDAGAVGMKGMDLEDSDLETWVRNTFVAKDYLEERLLSLQNITLGDLRSELDHTAAILMREISERLKKDTLLLVQTKYDKLVDNTKKSDPTLSENHVREIVRSVLAVYDADKTGLADYALESAGGQVLSTRCTENYQIKSAQISIFGIPLWYPSNTPRVVISPNVQPGNCWAFQGFPGHLVLKLNSMVYVTAFTLEHIPSSLSPSGNIQSAPRNFTVWGLEYEKDPEPVLFGEYEYVDNNEALQYFLVQNKLKLRPYNIVELRIETNHGNSLYTCLYRFRVHGNPAEQK